MNYRNKKQDKICIDLTYLRTKNKIVFLGCFLNCVLPTMTGHLTYFDLITKAGLLSVS